MLKKWICIILVLFLCPIVYGVAGHPHYKPIDFQRLAYKESIFQSACGVFDDVYQINQTGVLIEPHIVMTAAHGVAPMLTKRGHTSAQEGKPIEVQGVKVMFRLKNGQIIYKNVTHILVDTRYLSNEPGIDAKFDVGFLILESPITRVLPSSIKEEVEISFEEPSYVISYGQLLGAKTAPSGFALVEYDLYRSHPNDIELLQNTRTALYASIFPDLEKNFSSPPTALDSEENIRNYEAQKISRAHNDPAVALAQPGTSGAPVFSRDLKTGQYVLIGIVTSYAPLGMIPAIFKPPYASSIAQHVKEAAGYFQTIFALVRKEKNDFSSEEKQKVLIPDPNILTALKSIP